MPNESNRQLAGTRCDTQRKTILCMMKPRDEGMPRTDDIRTMNGESLNRCPKDVSLEVLDDNFDFRELRHEDIKDVEE